jgi:hypothetical protein
MFFHHIKSALSFWNYLPMVGAIEGDHVELVQLEIGKQKLLILFSDASKEGDNDPIQNKWFPVACCK